jgi:KaiC/GvpD/RAD55 family RecA-like ATPase
MFRDVVAGLAKLDVSAANVVADFVATRRESVGARLATALAAGKPVAEVRPILDEYAEWMDKDDIDAPETSVVQAVSVKDLVASRLSEGKLIKIAPHSLNDRLDGGLLRGHHMIVFARPEVGKSGFLVNSMAGFAKQGLKALYCGNEDPIEDIILRFICRTADMTKYEVLEDPERADGAARDAGYESVVFAQLAPGSPREIEALVLEHSPDVLLIDQLRNVEVGEENFVRALEKAAKAVRNIGKRHDCLVISVTQAGDSASYKSVLDMGDVDNSNTGIPAQADVLLGIGMSHEDEARGMRVFSLCKNKSSGNHDFWPVRFDAAKSMIRST